MSKFEFNFSARNPSGALVKGKVKASSEMEVRSRLREGGYKPVSVKLVGKQASFNIDLFAKKVTPKEFQVFLRQLSVLLKSGVPLLESLQSLEESTFSPTFSRILKFIIQDIREGKTFSDAMASHPSVFQPMVVNLIKAGEQGGALDEVLERLGMYFEKRKKIKAKVVSALIYPVITIFAAVLSVSAILIFVMPKFETLFKSQGKDLPRLTQMVIQMSHALTDHWYVLAAIVFVLPLGLSFLYKSGPLKKPLDSLILHIPLFGDLVKRSAVARMSRTLSTLLKSGIRITEGIDITIGTMGNVVVDDYMRDVKEGVISGKPFSDLLKQTNFFPVIVTQMVSIGEKTGNLDSMLEKVASFYEEEVEQTAEHLTSLLEPLVIILLGAVIGTLVVAMFLPIFNMGNAFV